MSALAAVVGLLEGIGTLLSATKRLTQAERDSRPTLPKLPTEPPSMGDVATAYLRGANDETWRQYERARLSSQASELGRKVAQDDVLPEGKS